MRSQKDDIALTYLKKQVKELTKKVSLLQQEVEQIKNQNTSAMNDTIKEE